jgi:hypothetical protein
LSTRRYSTTPLPAERYLPGRGPHPRAQAGSPPPAAHPLAPDDWQQREDYLYAIDLFNRGYWWEAHERFEELWRATGRDTPVGRFLQALIQIAGALLKRELGSNAAASGLARAGLGKLDGLPGVLLGIGVSELAASVEAYFNGRSGAVPSLQIRQPGGRARSFEEGEL